MTQRTIILGAAGRDFHNFNVFFRDNPDYEVVAFTATQIPYIDSRRYPAELAGKRYPKGIPIVAESDLDPAHPRRAHRPGGLCLQRRHLRPRHAPGRTGHGGRRQLHAPRPAPDDAAFHQAGDRCLRLAYRCGQEPDQPRRRARICGSWACARSRCAIPCPMATSPPRRCSALPPWRTWNAIRVTIEEREEYEPHVMAGGVIYAGRGLRAHPAPGRGRGRCGDLGRRQQRSALLQARSLDHGGADPHRADHGCTTIPAR